MVILRTGIDEVKHIKHNSRFAGPTVEESSDTMPAITTAVSR